MYMYGGPLEKYNVKSIVSYVEVGDSKIFIHMIRIDLYNYVHDYT